MLKFQWSQRFITNDVKPILFKLIPIQIPGESVATEVLDMLFIMMSLQLMINCQVELGKCVKNNYFLKWLLEIIIKREY